jgi:methylation protein EvaC
VPSQSNCRLNGDPLELVLDLGRQPLGNGFLTEPSWDEYFYHLQCGFSESSRLFQLIEQPDPSLMFHQEYAFFSGTSNRMVKHFSAFADSVIERGYVTGADSFIVELGSNDGIFLRNFAAKGIPHLGVEPSGMVADVSVEHGVHVVREFFDRSLARRILDEQGPADVISAANVMCHIPDLEELADGIALLLKEDGVLIFEDPYLGDVIRLGSYDQIYDEHVFLFSALSVQAIFGTVGMELINLEPQTTHGGSMRYTVGKIGRHTPALSVGEVLADELAQGLHRPSTYHEFALRVAESGRQLREALEEIKRDGRSVAAYGATSKSTTIYNYAGIGPDHIDFICDNTPLKISKLSPGVHIPIVAEEQFRANPPDVAFLAAWNHEREVRDHNAVFEAGGGRWLTHVPKVRFLD